MRADPNPVWDLFRRRTFSQVAYWSVVLGYDPRDRSLTNRFYFIYFLLFWAAWFVAGFVGLGSALAGLLATFPAVSPPGLAVLLGDFALAGWGLVQLWQVTGRSPFVFSEPDSYLLCQTPLDRRSVGLAWFLMDWFGSILPFAAGAVLFAFTLVEATLPGGLTLASVLAYFTSSLRAVAVVVPLQMGLQAALWGLGAFRLRRDRPPEWLPWLRLAAMPFGAALLAAAFLPSWRVVVLCPLTFPLQAAFTTDFPTLAWLEREILVLLFLAFGLVFMSAWARRIHLGRAARETRLQSTIRLAASTLNFELADILRHRERMKTTRPPSRLPVRRGAWMLAWKDLLQSQRSVLPGVVLRWAWVFSLSLGIFIASGWVVRLILGGMWTITLGGLTTNRLRTDLARWWLLRSLPLRASRLLLAELGLSCEVAILLGWLSLPLVGSPTSFDWLFAALLPLLVASAALGTARDILDHAKARVLMTPALAEENVPRQDIQGMLTILVSVGLPLGLLLWTDLHGGGFLGGLISLPLAFLITAFNFRSVLSTYRWIK
jgi:hypothetical protein